MSQQNRFRPGKYETAELISEVNGLCPMCLERLVTFSDGNRTNLCEAAHIYPHSPTKEEEYLLRGVPRLSEDPESIDNLIMLCPSCHHKFDNPRTLDGYMHLYRLKQQLLRQNSAKRYYKDHSIETDVISLLNYLETIDISTDLRKLSYSVMTVKDKMSKGASLGIQNVVIQNVRDYYIPIREALTQLEHDTPGKSDLIAKEISLFYSKLKSEGYSQDEIYYTIVDWLDKRTAQQFKILTPVLVAYYVQNCEVFTL